MTPSSPTRFPPQEALLSPGGKFRPSYVLSDEPLFCGKKNILVQAKSGRLLFETSYVNFCHTAFHFIHLNAFKEEWEGSCGSSRLETCIYSAPTVNAEV